MQAFVNECERDFEARLESSIARISADPELCAVGLSGPTCSGKTTAAKKLTDDFSRYGKNVHIISIDDFFKDSFEEKASGELPDFESIAAIDLDAFYECVDAIFGKRKTKIPHFDFVTGRRSGYTEIAPSENDLYIFEGIQAIYPEIREVLSRTHSKSVYICAQSSIDVGGKVFDPNEIRLMRRIVRDSNFRGATPEYTMFLWEGVRANEEKNIYPYCGLSDVSIDSTMTYDVCVLAQFLRPLLLTVGRDSKNYKEAQELLEKIEGIESIPSVMIPDGSLYYEFIKNEHTD